MTQAEQISARYQHDGQVWHDADGVALEDALRTARARRSVSERDGELVRWELPDGSVIVTAGGGWDLALCPEEEECYCWVGAGPSHSEHCPRSEESR